MTISTGVEFEQLVLSMEVEGQAELEAGQLKLFGIDPDGELSSSLESLLIEAKNTRPPTLKEERELGKRILAGEVEAQHELVQRNIQLAVWMAKKYSYYKVPLEDLIQTAMYAMLRAAPKFDYEIATFSNYVFKRIRTQLEQIVSDSSLTLTCPSHWFAVCRHIHAANTAITKLNGGVPATVDEVLAGLSPQWTSYRVTSTQVAEVITHRAIVDERASLDDEVRGMDNGTTTLRSLQSEKMFVSPEVLAIARIQLEELYTLVESAVCAIPKGRYRAQRVRIFTIHYGINSSSTRRTYKDMATLPGFPKHYQSMHATVAKLWKIISRKTALDQEALKEVLKRIVVLAEGLDIDRSTLFKDYDIPEVVVFLFYLPTPKLVAKAG